MDIEVEQLISLVQARPIVWDKTLEEYKYKNLSLRAWKEICCNLNENFETMDEENKKSYEKMVLSKWRNIKDCWMKKNKKVERGKKSGSGSKRTKKYIYDDQLQFLKKNTSIQKTSTSLLLNNLTSDSNVITEVASSVNATPGSSTSKHKKDDIDKDLVDTFSKCEDRHLSFFRGILPSLQNFGEPKIRQFQIAVLQIIDNLDNNLPAFGSIYQPCLYNQDNNSYGGYRSSSNQSIYGTNIHSPQNQPLTSTSVKTNLSDDEFE